MFRGVGELLPVPGRRRREGKKKRVWSCVTYRSICLSHHLVLQHPEAVLAQPSQVLELVLRPRAYPERCLVCTRGAVVGAPIQ